MKTTYTISNGFKTLEGLRSIHEVIVELPLFVEHGDGEVTITTVIIGEDYGDY